MKRFTKYYLVRNPYLSDSQEPNFFVQLNYGGSKVDNSTNLSSEEFLSRNKNHDKISNPEAVVPKVSNSNSTVLSQAGQSSQGSYSEGRPVQERYTIPERRSWASGPTQVQSQEGPRQQAPSLRRNQSLYYDDGEDEEKIEEDWNDDDDDDQGPGGERGGFYISRDEMEGVEEQLARMEDAASRSYVARENAERRGAEQMLNDLEKSVVGENSDHDMPTAEMASMASSRATYRDPGADKHEDSTLNSFDETVVPGQPDKLQETSIDRGLEDLVNQMSDAPTALNTPEKKRPSMFGPAAKKFDSSQSSDIFRTSQLRSASTPTPKEKKGRRVQPLLASLEESIIKRGDQPEDADLSFEPLPSSPIKKPQVVPLPEDIEKEEEEVRISTKPPESSPPRPAPEVPAANETSAFTFGEGDNTSSMMSESSLNESGEAITEPIEAHSTLPLNVPLPRQINPFLGSISGSLTLTQGGNSTTIPLTVTLPVPEAGDTGPALLNVSPTSIPPNIRETLKQNSLADAEITIQQGEKSVTYPFYVGVPAQDEDTFNAADVPQSTNIFHLTFFPNDAAQSTKVNESSVLESSGVGNNDSTLVSNDVLPVQPKVTPADRHLNNLQALLAKENQRRRETDLNKLTLKKKRKYHDVTHLQGPKERNAKKAAVTFRPPKRENYLREKDFAPQKSFMAPGTEKILKKKAEAEKRKRGDVSNLADNRPALTKTIAVDKTVKVKNKPRYHDPRKIKIQQSFNERRNLSHQDDLLDELDEKLNDSRA